MIKIRGMEKSFSRMPVLKSINLDIGPHKVTAVLGPNASGKTTLIKIILGLIKADAGEISIGDKILNGDWEYRSSIGYMPQLARFPENLSPRQALNFIRELRDRKVGLDEDLLIGFKLESELDKPFRTLSGGTRQKISAVLAFLFDPDILILDEPTVGLDPVASRILKKKINIARDNGKTIVLTSHIMSEVEELADDIVFLLEGRIHFEGAVHSLLDCSRESRLEGAIAQILTGVTP